MKFTKVFLMLSALFAVNVFPDTLTTSIGSTRISVADIIPSLDTIGGSDSFTVCTSPFKPDYNYNYVLSIPTITGTGSDSVSYQIRTKAYSESGKLMQTYTDTITVATGKLYLLPFKKIVGRYFEVKIVGVTGNGGQHILNGLWLDRYK